MSAPGVALRKNGTVTMPMTPPVAASAWSSSSDLPRSWGVDRLHRSVGGHHRL